MGRIKKQNVYTPSKPEIIAVEEVSSDIVVERFDDQGSSTSETPIIVRKTATRRRKKKPRSHLESLGSGTLRYTVDILTKILSLLKWPLALFLTISLARFLLMRSLSRITGAVQSQVRSGVCAIPFAAPIIDNALPGFCELSKTKMDFNDLINLQKETVKAASIPVYSGSLPLKYGPVCG